MPATLAQSVGSGSNKYATSLTFPAANTAGNASILLFFVQAGGIQTPIVKDTAGNQYRLIASCANSGVANSWNAFIYACIKIVAYAAGNIVTAYQYNGQPFAANTQTAVDLLEVNAGTGYTLTAVDGTASTFSASVATLSTPLNAFSAGSLLVAAGFTSGAASVQSGTGFTALPAKWYGGFLNEYLLSGVQGANTVGITQPTANYGILAAAAFAVVSNTVPAPPPQGLVSLGSGNIGSSAAYSITMTGTLANGSPTISSLSNANFVMLLSPGMTVSGTGIPAGTTLLNLNSDGVTVAMSQNATAAGAVSITFTSANPLSNLLDGNSHTWWDNPNRDGTDWAGVDCGVATYLTAFRFSVRAGCADNLIYAIIQASNSSTFPNGLNLYTVLSRPQVGTLVNAIQVNCPTAYRYFRILLPAASNAVLADLEFEGQYAASIAGSADIVQISPLGGYNDLATVVTLKSASNQATIYYTTDGSTPTTASSLYSGPFLLTNSCTVKALAVQAGLNNSRVTQAQFDIGVITPGLQQFDVNRGAKMLSIAVKLLYDPVSGLWYRTSWNADCIGLYADGNNPQAMIGTDWYSSPDLRNWSYVQTILFSSGSPPAYPPGLPQTGTQGQSYFGDRSKILYNAANNNYVLWLRSNKFTIFTSPGVLGPWTLIGQISTANGYGVGAGDWDAFVDSNGIAYLYCVTGDLGRMIAQLDPTYTQITTTFLYISVLNHEGLTMSNIGGTYYFVSSQTSGWMPNTNLYASSPTPIPATWPTEVNPFQQYLGYNSPGYTPKEPNYLRAFDSQNAVCRPIPGRPNSALWCGDRYDTTLDGTMSNYALLMLPATANAGVLSISWLPTWNLDQVFPSDGTQNPPAPSGLTVTAGSGQFNLSWTNNATLAYSLYVDRAIDAHFTRSIASQTLSRGQTSFVDTYALTPGQTYYYRIRAVNASGSSVSNTAFTGVGLAFANINGTWNQGTLFYNNNGVWQQVEKGYANIGGTWTEIL